MSVVAVYNMKGGVGKSTTAVNLSYLAAASGRRTLLWDLDPQAASSFALRVRPRFAGFGKKSLRGGRALAAAIKETDYPNLDLLPADFAYRKLDRLLEDVGKPERVMPPLLATLSGNYDVVFLDCPAGLSLLIEGLFAAADLMLVPTIPTVLSMRMVARAIKWAGRSDSPGELAVFFSMVDRRKALHRRACEWSAAHPDIFLSGRIPYASVVEQMAVRRMPLAVFAARDCATIAFAGLWAEVQTRLSDGGRRSPRQKDRWGDCMRAVESLIVRLEAADQPEHQVPDEHPHGQDEPSLIHSFDTEQRDLQRCGRMLELRERRGSMFLVLAASGSEGIADTATRVQARIDSSWALEILSGAMSPLAALERRMGGDAAGLLESARAMVGGRRLQRIDSRAAAPLADHVRGKLSADPHLEDVMAPAGNV